ncbi:MAG: type II toxin-antitoxin system death-on-curing family toxin [Clostridia bacterium]|nr:type II toxin-antitoxin system death-on-curing family toxin [Clostridia bacterium]
MIRISLEKVISLHEMISQQTGGDPNIRDIGLLEGSLEGPFQTFGNVELYPSLLEKGVRLGFSLISNHPFVDGNKRIGMLVMLVFLEINGVFIKMTNQEFIKVGLGVASGTMKYDELLEFIKAHVE